MITVTHRWRFPAAHVLRHPVLSDAENRRVYGKCANPNGHGHDYGVEISVRGEPDPDTGFVLHPAVLEQLVRERVLDRFSHRMLNDDPAFSGERVPTAENIAIVVHDALAGALARGGRARLARVRVVETARNYFDYGADA